MAINRTYPKASELAAVNIILSNIGQAPVTNLVSGNPVVEMAEQILHEVSRSVQAEGWVFNTEKKYPFVLDQKGEIAVPFNVIALDLTPEQATQLVQRGGKLYNKIDHSYTFARDLYLDVIWLFDFEELPEPFKNYITIRAANVFAGRAVGSQEAVRFGQQEELMARASALEYETQQGDYSIFDERDGNHHYNGHSYMPINTLRRR